VENAEEPYTLVFSENFHKAWKLYFNDRPIDDQQYGETVASYFDGDIKEGTHRNSFLDRNILENWFKKPTSETNHLLANGYANSWRITPQDTDGKEKYELIVEFKPQQFFYLGLLISTMTLFGCCLYLLWLVIKKKWKKN